MSAASGARGWRTGTERVLPLVPEEGVNDVADPLAKEKAYLRSNQAELAAKYPGKYLLIKGASVRGAFETYEQGITEGTKLLGRGPFLVRSVLQPDDAEAPSIPALSVGVPFVAHP